MSNKAYFKPAAKLAPTAKRKIDKDFTVLDFNVVGDQPTYSFKANEATRNILITGETGSGKSNNFILPAVQNFIKNDCPGIVFDIKSDLYSSIHAIAKKENKLSNIMFVGVHDFCEDINILSSIKTTEQLKNVLFAMQPAKDEINAKWFYWGINDVLDVVSIHKWYTEEIDRKSYSFDLREINRFILDKEFTRNVVDEALSDIEVAPLHIATAIKKVMTEPFSLYPKTRKGYFGDETDSEDSEVAQQRTWRSGQISAAITEITKDPFYSKLFNTANPKTVHDYIYKEGKLMVLTIPLEHESTGYLVSRLLREVYFKAVCQNEIDDLSQYKIGEAFNRYTVLVIDEYQFYINTVNENGVITDDNWLSISRGFANINVFATQSISSMYSKSKNPFAVDTIVQNFANKVFLKSSDKVTCEHVDFITNGTISGSQASHILLSPYEGERRGIFKMTARGGVRSDIFDYSINTASQYINSDEFKKLKKQSSTLLKSNPIQTELPADGTFRISSKTKNFFMLSNGEHVRKIDFDRLHSVDSLIKAFNHDLAKDEGKEFIRNFITTTGNVAFGDEAVAYMKRIARELKAYENSQGTKRHALQELDEFNDSLCEIYNQRELSTEDHNQQFISKFTEKKNTITKLVNAHDEDFKLKTLAIVEGDTDFMKHFDDRLGSKTAKISAEQLNETLTSVEFRQTEVGSKIVKLLKNADVICLLKCSEATNHQHTSVFNKMSLIPTLKKINPFCSIISALGKSEDVFLADIFADYSLEEWDYATHHINSILEGYYRFNSDYIHMLMAQETNGIEEQSQLEIIKKQEEVIKEQSAIIKHYESNKQK